MSLNRWRNFLQGDQTHNPEIQDDWETIIENIHSGDYKTKYQLGDYKPLDMGTEGILNMQLVGIEVDDKADGTGKAPTTWLSKEVLKTKQKWNQPVDYDYDYAEVDGKIFVLAASWSVTA